MKPSTKEQIEGKFHQVKGKIKVRVGRATMRTDAHFPQLRVYRLGSTRSDRERTFQRRVTRPNIAPNAPLTESAPLVLGLANGNRIAVHQPGGI